MMSWEKFWSSMAEMLCSYFRVDLEGLEKLPARGPAIVIANHSGCSGMDAMVLSHLLHSRLRRQVRVLAHPLYFDLSKGIRQLSLSFGLRKACYREGLRALREGKILVVFPEAEVGNFKSSLKRYRLQPFHSGFLRLALATGAPVVSCVITGAEESHWNLGSLNFPFGKTRLRVPFPLHLLPLPSKWKIRFVVSERFAEPSGPDLVRRDWIRQVVADVRAHLQSELLADVRSREFVYLPPLRDQTPRPEPESRSSNRARPSASRAKRPKTEAHHG